MLRRGREHDRHDISAFTRCASFGAADGHHPDCAQGLGGGGRGRRPSSPRYGGMAPRSRVPRSTRRARSVGDAPTAARGRHSERLGDAAHEWPRALPAYTGLSRRRRIHVLHLHDELHRQGAFHTRHGGRRRRLPDEAGGPRRAARTARLRGPRHRTLPRARGEERQAPARQPGVISHRAGRYAHADREQTLDGRGTRGHLVTSEAVRPPLHDSHVRHRPVQGLQRSLRTPRWRRRAEARGSRHPRKVCAPATAFIVTAARNSSCSCRSSRSPKASARWTAFARWSRTSGSSCLTSAAF